MAGNMASHTGDVWAASKAACVEAQEEGSVTRYEKDSFLAKPIIFIDYAVMENAEKIAMVLPCFGWSDFGRWDAVAGSHRSDEDDESAVSFDAVQFVGTHNTHIEGMSHKVKVIAASGVENLVAIDLPDALLVAECAKSQNMKLVVEALKASTHAELTEIPATVCQPLATYVTLKQEVGYQVRGTIIAPG